jgi:simple sugar transport system permease protein
VKRLVQAALVGLGLLVVVVVTLWSFGLPVGPSLADLWQGAFGDRFGLARTLVRATPLVLCALGIVVAWRARMFNIGGEGQYVMGGVCGAWVAKSLSEAPAALLNPMVLVGACLGGALYAGLAGWLHVRRGVQVVISTILLNFIALKVLSYAVTGPLQQASRQNPMTDPLPDDAMLARLDPQSDLHAGVFLAFAAALALFVYLYRTRGGFHLRLTGENPSAARTAKLDTGRVQMRAMVASGAFCGLAGGVDYSGFIGQVGLGFSQNWGFLSIPVALLGGLHPLGVALSGVFFGALFAGSENLAMFNTLGETVVLVIQAVAVLVFVGVRSWLESRLPRQEGA